MEDVAASGWLSHCRLAICRKMLPILQASPPPPGPPLPPPPLGSPPPPLEQIVVFFPPPPVEGPAPLQTALPPGPQSLPPLGSVGESTTPSPRPRLSNCRGCTACCCTIRFAVSEFQEHGALIARPTRMHCKTAPVQNGPSLVGPGKRRELLSRHVDQSSDRNGDSSRARQLLDSLQQLVDAQPKPKSPPPSPPPPPRHR